MNLPTDFRDRIIIHIVIFLFCLCYFPGCASLKRYERSDDFDKSKYKRVGLLVNRMGNKHEGVMAPITIATNYSNRIPKRELSSGMLYMKEHKDVYIEDDKRLLETFSNYPCFRYDQRRECVRFYNNITPKIYANIESILDDKAYEVVDVRKIAETWNHPISEMNIEKIISGVENKVDALLVFHYFDVERSGILSGLWYTLSTFDVDSRKRILFFKSFYSGDIERLLHHDPEVPKENIVEVQDVYGITVTKTIGVKINLSEKEIIDYHMKYMRCGFNSSKVKIRGLESVIP